jgi:hypothetical protein
MYVDVEWFDKLGKKENSRVLYYHIGMDIMINN